MPVIIFFAAIGIFQTTGRNFSVQTRRARGVLIIPPKYLLNVRATFQRRMQFLMTFTTSFRELRIRRSRWAVRLRPLRASASELFLAEAGLSLKRYWNGEVGKETEESIPKPGMTVG